MEKEVNQCGDLIVKASIKSKIRFKAGSELSSKVNLRQVHVEVSDVSEEDTETFDIMLHFKACAGSADAE